MDKRDKPIPIILKVASEDHIKLDVASDDEYRMLMKSPYVKGGLDGEDGFSPIAWVEQLDNGALISITDKAGTTSAEIKNIADYEKLINHPQINNITLIGNKTAAQLDLQEPIQKITNSEIDELIELFVG